MQDDTTYHKCKHLADPPSIADCSHPGNITNGSVDTSEGTTYGQSAIYTCNTGYYISGGNETRTCLHEGIWDGIKPNCALYGICNFQMLL